MESARHIAFTVQVDSYSDYEKLECDSWETQRYASAVFLFHYILNMVFISAYRDDWDHSLSLYTNCLHQI